MITPKAINLNIDFENSTPQYCEFLRGDSIQFNFTFNDTYNATKLRVLCYTKRGEYAFGNEFEDLTKAIFYTNYTAGFSGQAVITVQLLDDEENLVNSANVVCKIIESNTQTPFVVSPDFANKAKYELRELILEGKQEIREATTDAKEEIDGWSDQSTRLANAESDIKTLSQIKSNRGELYLNCGALTTTKKDSLLNPFSYIWTLAMTQEEFIKHKGNSPAFFGNENYFGSPTTYQGWAVCRTSETNVLFGMSGINTSSGYTYTNVNVLPYLDGILHVWSVVYTGNQLKLIIDGNVLSTISAMFNVEQSRIPFQIGQSTLTSTANNGVWGKFSRIKYFNFDITSADAPYTLADYINGKDESPLLKNNQPVVSYPTNMSGLSVVENKVVLTNTVKIQPKPFVAGTFKSGKTYKIRVQGTITGVEDAQSLRIYLPTDKFIMYRTDVSTGEVEDVSAKASVAYTIKPNGKEYIVEIEFVATSDSTNSNTYMSVDPLDTSVENWFTMSVWTDGVLLSLADYSIQRNSTTKVVLDESGNGNVATITGNVVGSKDSAISAFIDELKTQITQSS